MSLRLYVWAQLLPKPLCDTTNKESIEAKVWLATCILPSYLQACLALAGTSTWAGHLLGDHRQVGLHCHGSYCREAAWVGESKGPESKEPDPALALGRYGYLYL